MGGQPRNCRRPAASCARPGRPAGGSPLPCAPLALLPLRPVTCRSLSRGGSPFLAPPVLSRPVKKDRRGDHSLLVEVPSFAPPSPCPAGAASPPRDGQLRVASAGGSEPGPGQRLISRAAPQKERERTAHARGGGVARKERKRRTQAGEAEGSLSGPPPGFRSFAVSGSGCYSAIDCYVAAGLEAAEGGVPRAGAAGGGLAAAVVSRRGGGGG